MGHCGSPGKNGDTSYYLAKAITQNIAYAAYHQPRTINEIAEELGINPIFVEDEVAVLEEYAFMDKLPNGKYRTNILITEFNETMYNIYREIMPKYSKLLAEKFFAPVLEKVTEIPDWIKVPDNDINLLKWSMVCYLVQRLEKTGDRERYMVKRPDGGEYIAHASVDVKPDWEMVQEENIYWRCGHMWDVNTENGVWWKSYQFNCYWTGRTEGWRDNLYSDYDKMYFWMNGQLPESTANVEDYARLLEKGYLIKTDDGYKCNLILCDSESKWWSIIPEAADEANAIMDEYSAKALEAELYGQPEHMRDLIKEFNTCCVENLHTRIMKVLLDMGVLKLPTPEQKKGLCTVMFLGE